jgi:ribosomal protein S12 methylthiotransferase
LEKKKIHIVSLGCPKNLIDSEVMAAILFNSGFQITPYPEEAEIILINTCTFVLPAKEESIGEIFRMARFKEDGKCRYLVITGCLPQRYGLILEKEIPEVDLFLGTGEIPNIAGFIRKLDGENAEAHRSFIGDPDFLMDSSYPRLISTPSYMAYLKIAEGCSNHCSYCVIPLVRGRFRSRKVDDILKETEILANGGIKEIILTAQETTAYGKDLKGKPTLATLMKGIASINGIRWIRLLYTYPFTITNEILETIAEEEKICNYIDIPVQHIDDDILKSMNRRGNSQSIKDIIRKSREIIPGVALRTSLIVGFPGETPEKFNRLLEFIKETQFDHLGVFKYSQEEGTKAAELPFQVSEEEKEERRKVIMEEQSIISYEINQSLTDSIQEIIIEEKSDIPGYTYVGRLQRQSPDIDGITYVNAQGKTPGDVISCKITSADEYDLYAEEVGS